MLNRSEKVEFFYKSFEQKYIIVANPYTIATGCKEKTW